MRLAGFNREPLLIVPVEGRRVREWQYDVGDHDLRKKHWDGEEHYADASDEETGDDRTPREETPRRAADSTPAPGGRDRPAAARPGNSDLPAVRDPDADS